MMAERQTPTFVVTREPHFKSLWEGLAVLCWTRRPLGDNLRIYKRPLDPKMRPPLRAFFSSALLHFALIFFLVRIPFSALLHRLGIGGLEEADRAPVKVFELQRINLADYLPALQSPGPGGHPGQGTAPKPLPQLGSTALDPRLTIVSNPPHADNDHQTIAQAPSKPEVKILEDIPLPNVVLGAKVALQEPPQVPAPKAEEPVPHVPQGITPTAAAFNPPKPPSLILNAAAAPIAQPSLPVPLPPSPTIPESAKGPESAALADLGPRGGTGDSAEALLALSLNPAPLTATIAIPEGNRAGAFSISPAGGKAGSPGGIAGADSAGGTTGQGSGGDMSTGSGSGNNGGGAGSATGSASEIGIVGKAASGAAGASGTLSPLPAALVYRVSPPPRPRKMAIVVTSGPTGGGGLRAYGVLHGGKVYTIYLPMSGNSWILEYCATDPAVQERNKLHTTSGLQVQLSYGLVPPSPEEQFDFRRLHLGPDQVNRMIILHGVIDKDGSVSNLKLLQGVQETADAAALAAFARWKFKPALLVGKPVEVEILVGIPAEASGS